MSRAWATCATRDRPHNSRPFMRRNCWSVTVKEEARRRRSAKNHHAVIYSRVPKMWWDTLRPTLAQLPLKIFCTILTEQGVNPCSHLQTPIQAVPQVELPTSSQQLSPAGPGRIPMSGADRAPDAGQVVGHLDVFDFVPLCFHLKGVNLVLILVHWTWSIGLTGENLHKISSLLAFTHCIDDAWIVIGDLNISRPPWLLRRGFRTWACKYLCSTNFEVGPTGSLIDFAFAPAAGQSHVR